MKSLFPLRQQRKRGIHKRKRKDWWQRTREYLWPSMGFLAWFRWLELHIKRQKGSHHTIALGIAIGVLAGSFPIMGQILAAVFIAWILRASMPLAGLATFISNPWTYLPLMAWDYKLGVLLMNIEDPKPLHEMAGFREVLNNFLYFWEHYYAPMLLGAFITGIVLACVVYVLVRVNILSYHLARQKFLDHRQKTRKEQWETNRTLPPKHKRKD